MAEMLEGQPPEVQSMLLRTSIVERMNGELADLLGARSGSEQLALGNSRTPTRSSFSLDPERRGSATTSCWRTSCALELRRTFAHEFLTCTAGRPVVR